MAFLGEAVVSALIGTLFKKLSSRDLLRFARQKEIVADINKWEDTLQKLHAVLADAEEKQLTSRLVKIWLNDLTDLAYDVEDILDEFATEAFIMPETTTTTTQPIPQVRKLLLIPSCCASLNFSPSAIKFNMKMRSKLGGITSRFQQISAQMNDLHLVESISAGAGRTTIATTRSVIPTETTCIVDESRVCGRESDKAAILELLLLDQPSDDDDDDAVRVIAITGMGGLGKTTLAQLAYNHDKVQTHFDLRVWVCVSDDFNVTRLTKTILQSVGCAGSDVNNLNQLQLKLKDQLSGKKFLLVLDDVWNENRRAWENFYLPLMKSGAQLGSRVIVTTRNQGVVEAVGATSTHRLKELSDDEFLSLLAQRALSARNFDDYPHLTDIAKQIAKKCGCLPLAAMTLGGMLIGNQNLDAWKEILESNIWNLPDQENNDILPALQLSYHHLPSHLKRCFAYCSIFPKDYEFEVNELVLLWMGEGFLDNVNGPRQTEEIGTEFFRELLARSFFQQPDPKSSHFVMHDLIHDLAGFVAGDTYINLEDKLENNEHHAIPEKARHSSFICQQYNTVGKFKAFGVKVKTNLRTLISLPIQHRWYSSHISQKVLHDLLTGMRCLRVLSFSGYNIKEVPDLISNLKHLRYLNFSYCSIERLPNSVGDLYNLHTLILRDCDALIALPKGIGKLTNLRHLDITGTSKLEELSFQVGNLTNLQTLSRFIVSRSGGLRIEELKNLSHLQGVLAISNLHEIVNVANVSDANLRNKQKLEELVMEWRDGNWDSRKSTSDHELQVLESLRPHENLKRLEVAFYGGWKFPRWIGDICFTKMVSLTLRGCPNCMSLPALGALPSLEVLSIEGIGKVASIGDEFYGGEYYCLNPFASLKELRFEDMVEWETWSYSSSASSSLMLQKSSNKRGAIILFPKLERLEIRKCPKLKEGLPKCMESPELGGGLASPHELLSEGHGRVEEGGVFILFSNLKILRIEECDNLEELPLPNGRLHGLEVLRISGCPKLESFPDTTGGLPPMLRRLEVKNCQRLKGLPLHNSSSSSSCVLESLKIENCPSLRCFHPPPTSSGGLPSTLKVLSISRCENLESLPPLMNNSSTTSTSSSSSSSSSSSLECLEIYDCKSLKLFPRELPSTLKRLSISNCSNLEAMPVKGFANNTSSLEYVVLKGYPNLRSLPLLPERIKELNIADCEGLECCFLTTTGSLSTPWPCNLTQLHINGCRQLKSLPHQMKDLNSLTHLSICGCPALQSFPQEGLAPTNLKELQVSACQNLKTPISEWGLQSLSSLSKLSIHNMFRDTVSFPVDDCVFPSSLTSLKIIRMPSLISLSLPNLASLTSLDVCAMESLASLSLPRLPSLTSLKITHMESLASLPLQNLTSLTSLEITSMEFLASLPLQNLTSLTSLRITSIYFLASLPLQNLTSLTYLKITSLESLASLPLQNLTSLRSLYIENCPKLRSLGSLLPATLESLDISECPIIRKRFLKRKGEFFSIPYIPCIRIDEELIHTPLKYNEQKWKCML